MELEKLLDAEPNTDVVKSALADVKGAHSDFVGQQMPELVKGRKIGPSEDDQALAAEKLFKGAIAAGKADPNSVLKGLSPQFQGALSAAINQTPQAYAMNQFVAQLNQQLEAQLGRSFTLTSPLSSSLTPYDLVAPTKLIYPVYSPFRNLIPRVPGQGKIHEAKVLTSISGALPGGLATPGNRMSIPELPAGGSMTQWPNQLPAAGSQTAIDITVPYRFFGLTEGVSWLSQLAGQGFDDIAGLASLVLLQEMMLLEERAIISATSINLSTPAAPTITQRTAGTGETPITGASTNVYVVVTAVNFFGETVASTAASLAFSAGDVVDVAIAPIPGAMAYNLYVGTGTATPSNSGFHLAASAVGGFRYTLMGALPIATATPPTADTGTGAATDYEGLLSTITGHSAGTIYPAGYQGSYINQSVGDVLSINAVNTALEAMWNGSNGFLANPDDLWVEASDVARFAQALANANVGDAGYRFFVNQDQVAAVRAGAAVREFVNPFTQKIINLQVHPYLTQGTALLLSWKLPHAVNNISNVWENVMVQDYLSISWPVIDVTFRYSLFMYGALFSPAVQYNGILQGIQKSNTTPYS